MSHLPGPLRVGIDPHTQFVRRYSDHGGIRSPVNGTVKFFDHTERQKLAAQGKALPDGSFPIRNTFDLHNAIREHGRAKDPVAARAHIKKRAAELGMTAAIPLHWL